MLAACAQVGSEASAHLLSLTIVVVKTARQPAIVALSDSAALLAVEVLRPARSDRPKELLIASRLRAGGLEL
jgi:hypothetical protein